MADSNAPPLAQPPKDDPLEPVTLPLPNQDAARREDGDWERDSGAL